MKSNVYIIITLLCATCFTSISAQDLPDPCGTQDAISPWLRAYIQNPDAYPRGGTEILYMPMKIHVVGTDNGTGYFSVNSVLKAFCRLNSDFADSGIQFYIDGDLHYINNSTYYDYNAYSIGNQMMAENNVDNVINCYILENPRDNVCGYYTYGQDAIALKKTCLQPNDHTWAHEVGHYLSLPHPFFGWEYDDNPHDFSDAAPEFINDDWPVEKMDGSNCELASDHICDTPPDYLDYRWNCNSEGFSNVVQHDPDSIAFQSDGTLYMSYSNSSCKTRFSDVQMDVMRANVLDVRPNQIGPSPVGEFAIPTVEEFTVLSPAPGETVEGASTITLEWEPIENATHYIVQVNPFNIFSVVFNQFIVEGTSVEFTALESDETFFWRVKPFSVHYTCTNFTDPNSFDTGSIVDNDELLAGEKIEIFPNPVRGDEVTVLFLTEQSENATVQMIDMLGRVLSTHNIEINPGSNYLKLNTANFSSGLYTIRIQMENRQITKKVLVQ